MSAEEICRQRKLFMQFNVPLSRLTKQSPYDGTITQQQLDMRRKAEILKYDKNSSSSNRLTQKQQFANITNPNYNANRVACTEDKLRPVPSSSSGIPGPIVYLFEDPSIPLYNYIKGTNPGAITLNEDETQWTISIETDVINSENIDTLFSTLVIKKAINQAALFYNVQVPVSYSLVGANLFTDTSGTIINVSNITSTFKAKYNDGVARTLSSNLPSNEMRVHLRPDKNVVTVGNSSTYSFSASIFAGYMNLNDVLIYTSPGNVYTFNQFLTTTKKLDLRTNMVEYTTTSQTELLNGVTFGMKLNAVTDTTFIKEEKNCTIISPPYSEVSNTFSITDSTGLSSSQELFSTSPFISVILSVKVAYGTNSFGSGNIFYVNDGISSISVNTATTYQFDVSDTTNSGHILAFSTTSNGTHAGGTQYINNVIYSGTPGKENAYVLIEINSWTPLPLYFYCKNHTGMGSSLVSS